MQLYRALMIATALSLFGAFVRAQEPERSSQWDIRGGTGPLIVPRYPGSDEYRVLVLPFTQITYSDRAFLGQSTVGIGAAMGVHAFTTAHFRLTAEFGVGDNRPAKRADALAGMEDLGVLFGAGASLSYRQGPWEAALGLADGFNDDAGLLGVARVSVGKPFGRVFVATTLSATMADAKQMRREFGISPAEALRRQILIDAGDPRLSPADAGVYQPAGGLRGVGASLSLMYGLSRHWSVMGSGGIEWLGNHAAASPLVRDRNQLSAMLGIGFQL